jgi:hypothetical protein
LVISSLTLIAASLHVRLSRRAEPERFKLHVGAEPCCWRNISIRESFLSVAVSCNGLMVDAPGRRAEYAAVDEDGAAPPTCGLRVQAAGKNGPAA